MHFSWPAKSRMFKCSMWLWKKGPFRFTLFQNLLSLLLKSSPLTQVARAGIPSVLAARSSKKVSCSSYMACAWARSVIICMRLSGLCGHRCRFPASFAIRMCLRGRGHQCLCGTPSSGPAGGPCCVVPFLEKSRDYLILIKSPITVK